MTLQVAYRCPLGVGAILIGSRGLANDVLRSALTPTPTWLWRTLNADISY